MNRFICTGNLAADAEVRYTANGSACTNFRIGVNRKVNGEEQTLWVDCSLWGRDGKEHGVTPYLVTGQKVLVAGPLEMREWTRRDGTVATTLQIPSVQEMELVGERKAEPRAQPTDRRPRQPAKQPAKQPEPEMYDDDIPF